MFFDHPDFDDHEHVSFFSDPDSGLRAIIAIHSSGPFGGAGGGCRMWRYDSDAAALRDALRLSRAMSYKLALAEVPSGGAKAVVMGDPAKDKTPALLRALGRAVHHLGGRYILGEDVGTTSEDMRVVGEETPFVMVAEQSSADPTAYGVLAGMQAAVRYRLGRDDLRGLRVAVQGVGRVGRRLCELLVEAGAKLTVTDVSEAARSKVGDGLGATVVLPDQIYDADADVFAPCALGSILNDATIPRLRAKIVVGAANNQLDREAHAEALAARGILYVPDFAVNAGGVIGASVAVGEKAGASVDDAVVVEKAKAVGSLIETVLLSAERSHVTPHTAAVELAKSKLRASR